MASFDNRGELNAEDLAVIKTLGFKFRGKQRWPLFRLFEPGFPPWAVDGAQARFLTAALEQAVVITQAFEDCPEKLIEQPGKVLVRVHQDMNGKARWVDQWRPGPQAPEGTPVPVPDTACLNQLANQVTQGEGILETDFFTCQPRCTGSGENVRVRRARMYGLNPAAALCWMWSWKTRNFTSRSRTP